MTSAKVLDIKGKSVREVNLEDEIFGIEPNMGLLHSALIRQQANARIGSANCKTRSEVRGGGKKPWRQKGTGRARAGSIRSPLWEGGGVIFGPKPRDYSISMPKKQRVLAVKAALAARREDIVVVENFNSLTNGKTKEFVAALKDLKLHEKRILLVLDYSSENDAKVQLAARNICGLKVISANHLNVKDLLHAEVVLTTESTIQAINARFKASDKVDPKAVKRSKMEYTQPKQPQEPKPKAPKPVKAEAPKAEAAPAKAAKAKNEDEPAAKEPKAKKEGESPKAKKEDESKE